MVEEPPAGTNFENYGNRLVNIRATGMFPPPNTSHEIISALTGVDVVAKVDVDRKILMYMAEMQELIKSKSYWGPIKGVWELLPSLIF